MLVGTPAYMSPEQAAGDPSVDHRADVYAWGILAYELLAGSHPFADRHTVQSLITAHLVEPPQALRDRVAEVGPAIAELVMRCLAKDPGDRPESGREIVDLLPARGDSAAHLMATRRLRRRPVLAALALAAAVGGSAGLFWLVRSPTTGPATPPVAPAAPGRPTPASPAADAYIRGKVHARSENREDVDAAIGAFQEAIAADPSFAPAYAGLSRAYSIKGFYFAPDSEKKRLREEAEVTLEKAFALDDKLAEAYFARGLLLWTPARRFPHEQAAQAYRQALALDPKMDEAHHQLALVLLHVGLLDQAGAEVERALAIDPANSLARFRLGVIALYRGDYERAWSVFNSTPLERNPTLWAFQAATALFRLGREPEATALLDRFLRDYPADEGGVGTSVRAMMLAKAGRQKEAEAAINRAVELGRGFGHFHHTAYNVASAYALLGNRAQAIRYLEEAADDGFPCYPLFARDAQLDGLRKDPRFVALLARLERDWTERQRTM